MSTEQTSQVVEKVCSRCAGLKPVTEFALDKRTLKNGALKRRARCKPCSNEYQRAHWQLRTFGLDAGENEKLLEGQGGVCAICSRPPKKLALATDHSHLTGLVRGKLCHRCNRLLGWVFDDADALERAAEYLRSPPATRILGREVYGLKGRVNKKKRGRPRKRGPRVERYPS